MVDPFNELMRKAGSSLMDVEAFSVHESGGLTAMVDGESVFCGNAAFMRLMGVVLPDKYVLNNGVYVAVAGAICGVFEMEYTASDAVKSALTELVGSGRHAIFAVRDFNITPSMLSVKFDMPTDGFDFPPYSERYAISGAEPSDGSKPSALISREGLGPLVSLADHGKTLFNRIRLSVMLSVMSARYRHARHVYHKPERTARRRDSAELSARVAVCNGHTRHYNKYALKKCCH